MYIFNCRKIWRCAWHKDPVVEIFWNPEWLRKDLNEYALKSIRIVQAPTDFLKLIVPNSKGKPAY